MREDVVRWAAAEAEQAAELYAREGLLESWHAEEFDLGTANDLEDFQRLAEAARDDVATSGVLLPGQTVLVRARLPWLARWPATDLEGADLDSLFDGAVHVDATERETPSIAVVDRTMAREMATDATSRFSVQRPIRLEGCALALSQVVLPGVDVDTWLLAAPDRNGELWPA